MADSDLYDDKLYAPAAELPKDTSGSTHLVVHKLSTFTHQEQHGGRSVHLSPASLDAVNRLLRSLPENITALTIIGDEEDANTPRHQQASTRTSIPTTPTTPDTPNNDTSTTTPTTDIPSDAVSPTNTPTTIPTDNDASPTTAAIERSTSDTPSTTQDSEFTFSTVYSIASMFNANSSTSTASTSLITSPSITTRSNSTLSTISAYTTATTHSTRARVDFCQGLCLGMALGSLAGRLHTLHLGLSITPDVADYLLARLARDPVMRDMELHVRPAPSPAATGAVGLAHGPCWRPKSTRSRLAAPSDDSSPSPYCIPEDAPPPPPPSLTLVLEYEYGTLDASGLAGYSHLTSLQLTAGRVSNSTFLQLKLPQLELQVKETGMPEAPVYSRSLNKIRLLASSGSSGGGGGAGTVGLGGVLWSVAPSTQESSGCTEESSAMTLPVMSVGGG